jgi:hypothetical protein
MAKIKEPPYTAEEEADFYRRNAGGPVGMTSLTRGRGFLGDFQPDAHLADYTSYHQGLRVDADIARRRLTYHDAHIWAWFSAVWTPAFLAKRT